MPFASTIFAPLGIGVPEPPTAAILPPERMITPFSITPCVTVNNLPPVIATGPAASPFIFIVRSPGVPTTCDVGRGFCAERTQYHTATVTNEVRTLFIAHFRRHLRHQSPLHALGR